MHSMVELAAEIRSGFESGRAGREMAMGGRLAAAKAAAEAKSRYRAGETDGCNTWKQWVERHVRLSVRWVDGLAKVGRSADPEEAMAAVREGKRQGMQKYRARQVEPRGSSPDPAKSRIRLDLPPRVDASSSANTDHVEREYTNLITVWNNSADPARARFLKAIGVSPSVVGLAA